MATGPGNSYKHRSKGRIVVIGDLHGHYGGLLDILRHAQLVGESLEWIGSDTVLVQMGDIFGRGYQSRMCSELLMDLQNQAPDSGGTAITILGNHEAMVTHRHLRYLPHAELSNFVEADVNGRNLFTAFNQATSPANELGRWLRRLPAVIVVDDVLFVHGGLEWEWAKSGIGSLNRRTREDMASQDEYGSLPIDSPIATRSGPLWNRRFVMDDQDPNLAWDLNATLGSVNAETMIVGHTPSEFVPGHHKGEIVSKFEGRLIGVDVGISPLYGSNYTYLEIEDGAIRPVTIAIDDLEPVGVA